MIYEVSYAEDPSLPKRLPYPLLVTTETIHDIRKGQEMRFRLLNKFNLTGFQRNREFIQKVKTLSEFFEESNVLNSFALQIDKQGNLAIYAVPKSRYYHVFSQNYSQSGKIGLSYELGVRNLLGFFETSHFKWEKLLGEGKNLEFSLRFPFYKKIRNSLEIFAAINEQFACEDIRFDNHKIGFRIGKRRQDCFKDFKLEFMNKRWKADPALFADYDISSGYQEEQMVRISKSKDSVIRSNFFHELLTRNEYALSYSPHAGFNLGYEFSSTYKFFVRKILPWKKFKTDFQLFNLEIENNNQGSMVLNPSFGAVSFNNYFIKTRARGFSNLEANIPFDLPGSTGRDFLHLNLSNSLKVNLRQFEFFSNEKLFPFFHLTSYAGYKAKRPGIFWNVAAGTGVSYKLSDKISLEVLYNFWHSDKRVDERHTKEACFQFRISFND